MEISTFTVWNSMGTIARAVVLVLTAMSIASLAVGAERGWLLRCMRRESLSFLAEWRKILDQNGIAVAVHVAQKFPRSPVAVAVSAATLALGRATDTASGLDAARHAIRRAISTTTTEVRRGLPLLATVGSTAPFVGLFGTVVGIVNAFGRMAQTGQGGLASVSSGIAEALVATALGILVAIPAVWLFNWLTNQTARLLALVDEAGEELAEVALAPRTGTAHAATGHRREGMLHGDAA